MNSSHQGPVGSVDVASPTSPLVSVVIATRNRPDELRETIRNVRRQTYAPMELIVIDDASTDHVESVVREEWPSAVFWRNPVNKRQAASRTDGMLAARGAYVLTLDDDASLTDPSDLARAVARMEQEPSIGVLTFFIFNGAKYPGDCTRDLTERYAASFMAGGAIFRSEVPRRLGGYLGLLLYEGEEEEFALRILAAGWRILLYPSVVLHHRVSPIGRNSAETWAYGFRNKLWIIVLHYPWHRALVEGLWKVLVNLLEAARRPAPLVAIWALASFARGLTAILRLRKPLSRHTLRQYDALRFRTVRSPDEWENPEPVSGHELQHWFRRTWLHRRRTPAFWQRSRTGIGRSDWAAFDDSKSVVNESNPPAHRGGDA